MSVEAPTRRRRNEVYNGLKTSLDVLTSVAKISPVPGLEGVITTVKSIMDIVEVKRRLTSRTALTFSDSLLGGETQQASLL